MPVLFDKAIVVSNIVKLPIDVSIILFKLSNSIPASANDFATLIISPGSINKPRLVLFIVSLRESPNF